MHGLDRRRLGVSRGLALAVAAVLAAAPASAQEEAGPLAAQSWGQGGETTIRAVRVDEPLELDGVLSEAIYGDVAPASGFIQQDPDNGAPVTEDTEVWVFYDNHNVYVAVRALDSRPGRIVANEMRRDNRNICSTTTSSSPWTRSSTGAADTSSRPTRWVESATG